MKRPGKPQSNQRTELLDQAAQLLRQNKLEPALKVYEALYEDTPQDWTIANALGDLHVRMRNNDAAIGVFMDLAEHMAEQGHAVKARALYRKVLRMRPNDPAATARVAELENEHLDASPIMQRIRGALLDAQGPRAVESAAAPEPAIAPDPVPVSRVPALETFQPPVFEPPVLATPALDEIQFQPPPPAPMFDAPVPLSAPPAAAPEAYESPFAQWQQQQQQQIPEAPAPPASPLIDFQPASDEWIPLGLTLASLPLLDSPPSPVAPARAESSKRMRAGAQYAVASGDTATARDYVEQFLQVYPHDVEALEMLVSLGVDSGLDDVATNQIRLADACAASGRSSSARHIAVDLVQRHPGDPSVTELADRILIAGRSTPAAAPPFAAPLTATPLTATPLAATPLVAAPAVTAATAVIETGDELFDDDGLVTDDGPRRSPDESVRGFDALGDWLDANDESDARLAFATASRQAAGGNIAGAMATLEPLMRTPGLRPIVGVQLAQLYRREGDYANALHCLEQAAEQPPVDADNAHALAYELALTLEGMGQRSEALALYRELLSEVGPAFRDVAARAEHLSAA